MPSEIYTPTDNEVRNNMAFGAALAPQMPTRASDPEFLGPERSGVKMQFDRWLAAHDAVVRLDEREKCAQIDLRAQDAAAFVLYKHERPESVAESWETVGLPIVLNYRAKANVVLERYFAAIRAQSEETDR